MQVETQILVQDLIKTQSVPVHHYNLDWDGCERRSTNSSQTIGIKLADNGADSTWSEIKGWRSVI